MKKNTAYIYIFDLDTENILETYPLLPEEEAKSHRPLYTKSRYLIRKVLEKHNISSESFYYAKSGQPLLQNNISISLSHCENIFVIALMETSKLGVDIQTHFMKNTSAFKRKYNIIHDDPTTLLAHWTKVEAYCKATQASLFQSLYPTIDEKITLKDLHYWSTQSPYNIALISDSLPTDVIIKMSLLP